MAIEHLDGQCYQCSHCNAKVDATRQMRIKQLPAVLCISLQRFVFDYKVCTISSAATA